MSQRPGMQPDRRDPHLKRKHARGKIVITM
jgi:hypothetical protein